ncbi:MAG: 4-(cytidine 5'-diphospho)-2-C-methyl-D-erythritol kinase [Oscillospiraceae bacterium]|nr:4-(cytidine 5'-diphospho)-2-C-methyl-D-erythritol kinase [Oscillospiraceae bacterium]
MRSVTVLAPAKLNLTLDITGLAENGYHKMDMLMQTVNLYETVTLRKASDLTLRLPGSSVPANQYNTAIKAALAFFAETGLLAGADITVHKAVPVRAGMAGGSADAAAVLVGLNALYRARLSNEALCAIGKTVGADVPFAIMGGTARVSGIGECIRPIAPCPPCWFCVCMPSMGISTPEAYAQYDRVGAKRHPDTDGAEAAIAKGDLHGMSACLYNVLQETSTSAHNAPICAALMAQGAKAALMTGSGAAVFGVFHAKRDAIAAKLALQKTYPQCWVLRPVPFGAKVQEQ